MGFWAALAETQSQSCQMHVPDRMLSVAVTRDDLGASVDVLLDNIFHHLPAGRTDRHGGCGARRTGDTDRRRRRPSVGRADEDPRVSAWPSPVPQLKRRTVPCTWSTADLRIPGFGCGSRRQDARARQRAGWRCGCR